MSYFNTLTYDPSNVSYNTELPIYLDGTTSSIPVNGTKYYGNVFGNVMCSFIVEAVILSLEGMSWYHKIYVSVVVSISYL